jgi:hypothetical protein
MKTTTLPAVTNPTIDFQMAQSILDKLGYSLQDLSLDYGDVVIPSGDISHQLYYSSIHSTINLMGYVWTESDLYYVGTNNHKTPEQAALELLDPAVVQRTAIEIELERAMVPDYI